MTSINEPNSNQMMKFFTAVKKLLRFSDCEDVQPIPNLSTRISVPTSELQQLLSYKAGVQVDLRAVDTKTIAVEKRIGGAIIGHTFGVSAKVSDLQNNKVHLSLSGSDLILSKLSQFQHPALSFTDKNELIVNLNGIDQLKSVLDKVEVVGVIFVQNNVVVDVRINVPYE